MTDQREGRDGRARQPEALKVGELARRTGLSVRTLHHYDEIGLLSPARRTASGHRLYGRDEIQRLQQIRSLQQLGFSLEEIRESLDGRGYTLERIVDLHIAVLDEQIEQHRRLRTRLEMLAGYLRSSEPVSVEELIKTIEVMTMTDKYYTTEQLEQLRDRRRIVGDERIQEAQAEWRELFEKFGSAMEAGIGPAGEPAQALARKAKSLIEEFTGGDPGIHRSLEEMHRDDPDGMYARWGVDAGVAEYMGRAMAALSQEAGPAC